ncbi:MAG: hypothetical protein L6408_02700 [Nanoarchaeota archaeon]|nr:hypothetical protein [Nanoarchaeota archaeon]
MSEIDFVLPPNKVLKVDVDATFNMHDLYKSIRSWVNEHSYITFEKEYRDWMKESGRSNIIKLDVWKKIDDYVKYHIVIKINSKDLKEVETKSGIMNKGRVVIQIYSWIEKDYENKWEHNFMTRFIRAINDHYFMTGKIDKYKEELLDESYGVFNEIKAFLGLHRGRT